MAHWRMASEGSMAGLGDFGGTYRGVGRMVKSGGGIEGDEARLTQSPVGADHGTCQCETADGEKGIKWNIEQAEKEGNGARSVPQNVPEARCQKVKQAWVLDQGIGA